MKKEKEESMNKYEEAQIFIEWYVNVNESKQIEVDDTGDTDKYVAILRELVDKEIERESRKEKLVVGSEWVCVVEHHAENTEDGEFYSIEVGKTVSIINVTNNLVEFRSYGERLDNIEHFLLCFKPYEEVA